MASSPCFTNLQAVASWCVPRFLHPVVVVEASEDAEAAARRNGLTIIQLLRPFVVCQGHIITFSEDRKRHVTSTWPFGVRLTRCDCVQSLGRHTAGVTEAHLRYLMKSSSSNGRAQQQTASSSSPPAAGTPPHTSSSMDHEGDELSNVLNANLLHLEGGPVPRPQYVWDEESYDGGSGGGGADTVSSPLLSVGQRLQGSAALPPPLRFLTPQQRLQQNITPPWFPPFLRDFHHLVRGSHVDTLDHPVGMLLVVSTHEGLAAAAAAADTATGTSTRGAQKVDAQKIVLAHIRAEVKRQYEQVRKRVWRHAPMMEDVVHIGFILVHDEMQSEAAQQRIDVGRLLRDCQEMSADATAPPLQRPPFGVSGQARDCWLLMTFNSSTDPTQHSVNPDLWVDANPLSVDVYSEDALDLVATSSGAATTTSPSDPHATAANTETYHIPFPWHRRVVRSTFPEDGTGNLRVTGCCLTEDNLISIQGAMNSYLANHLARFLERWVSVLSSEIHVRRTTTLGKVAAWFKAAEAKPKLEVTEVPRGSSAFGGPSSPTVFRFRASAIEMRMRRCADLCLFLQDFEGAFSAFKMCRDELLESGAYRQLVQPMLGGVQEAMVICQLFMHQPIPLPTIGGTQAAHQLTGGAGAAAAMVAAMVPSVAHDSFTMKSNACRLQVAFEDYVKAGQLEEKVYPYAMRVSLFMYDLCRQQMPRPVLHRGCDVLVRLLDERIPQEKSHLWGAVVHQLMGGACLYSNPRRPPVGGSGGDGDGSPTSPGSGYFSGTAALQCNLRQFVYHFARAGSYWFAECSQHVSSAKAALFCYRQVLVCCRSLYRKEESLGVCGLPDPVHKERGRGVQPPAKGWRCMVHDAVSRLLTLLLEVPCWDDDESGKLERNEEALDIVMFAVSHNIGCRSGRGGTGSRLKQQTGSAAAHGSGGDETTMEDVQLLFQLRDAVVSHRNSKMVVQTMPLPLLRLETLLLHLDTYHEDIKSQEAAQQHISEGGSGSAIRLSSEWKRTEAELRKFYQQPHRQQQQQQQPPPLFPSYVGDSTGIRVGPCAAARSSAMAAQTCCHFSSFSQTSPRMSSRPWRAAPGVLNNGSFGTPPSSPLALPLNDPAHAALPVSKGRVVFLSVVVRNPLSFPLEMESFRVLYRYRRPFDLDRSSAGALDGPATPSSSSFLAHTTAPAKGSGAIDAQLTVSLNPYEWQALSIPLTTAAMPCGEVEVIGFSWKLLLPSLSPGSSAAVDCEKVSFAGTHFFDPLRSNEDDDDDDEDGHSPPYYRSPDGGIGGGKPLVLLITAPCASLSARFDPPLPSQVLGSELIVTNLILTNHSIAPCGTAGGAEEVEATVAHQVTVGISPHNTSLICLHTDGLHATSAPSPLSSSAPFFTEGTYTVAATIPAGSSIAVPVSIRARASEKTPAAAVIHTDVMLMVAHVVVGKKSGGGGTFSQVLLHRLHRRIAVQRVLSVAAIPFLPGYYCTAEEEEEASRRGESPLRSVVSVMVTNHHPTRDIAWTGLSMVSLGGEWMALSFQGGELQQQSTPASPLLIHSGATQVQHVTLQRGTPMTAGLPSSSPQQQLLLESRVWPASGEVSTEPVRAVFFLSGVREESESEVGGSPVPPTAMTMYRDGASSPSEEDMKAAAEAAEVEMYGAKLKLSYLLPVALCVHWRLEDGEEAAAAAQPASSPVSLGHRQGFDFFCLDSLHPSLRGEEGYYGSSSSSQRRLLRGTEDQGHVEGDDSATGNVDASEWRVREAKRLEQQALCRSLLAPLRGEEEDSSSHRVRGGLVYHIKRCGSKTAAEVETMVWHLLQTRGVQDVARDDDDDDDGPALFFRWEAVATLELHLHFQSIAPLPLLVRLRPSDGAGGGTSMDGRKKKTNIKKWDTPAVRWSWRVRLQPSPGTEPTSTSADVVVMPSETLVQRAEVTLIASCCAGDDSPPTFPMSPPLSFPLAEFFHISYLPLPFVNPAAAAAAQQQFPSIPHLYSGMTGANFVQAALSVNPGLHASSAGTANRTFHVDPQVDEYEALLQRLTPSALSTACIPICPCPSSSYVDVALRRDEGEEEAERHHLLAVGQPAVEGEDDAVRALGVPAAGKAADGVWLQEAARLSLRCSEKFRVGHKEEEEVEQELSFQRRWVIIPPCEEKAYTAAI